MYVDDDHWQEAIRSELQRSQAVVVQPGLSAGVQWELEEIRARIDPHRVLLCLVSFWRNPQAYEDLASLARKSRRLELPRVVPFLNRPSFVYFERGWVPRLQELSYKNPVLWPLTADAADLVYSLHPFAQGMHGGEREMPRQPRWDRGAGKATAAVAALLLALIVAMVPVLAVRSVAHYVVGAFVGPTASQKGPTPPSEQYLMNLVTQSSRTTLEGRSVPYRFDIPETFLKLTSKDGETEYWRRSPDGRMTIEIIAYEQREDLSASELAKGRLERNSGEDTEKLTLKSAGTVSHAGVDWVESRIVGKLKNGATVRETARYTTGPAGTVLVFIHMVESPVSDPTYERLTEEILESFRLFERSGGDVKSAEPGPASGANANPGPTEKAAGDRDPGSAIVRGSDVQGPVWNDQYPRGHYLLGAEKIRLIFGQTAMAPETGKLLPAWSSVHDYADQLDSDLHVASAPFNYALLEPQVLLILKLENVERKKHSYIAVYRDANGAYYTRRNTTAVQDSWKPLGEGESGGGSWTVSDTGRVNIEITRPNANADEKGREN